MKKLDNAIIALLIISCIYGVYSIAITYVYNTDTFVAIKSNIPLYIFTFIYVLFRKKIQGTEFIISIYFLVKYTIYMPKGFSVFNILYGQVKVMLINGMNFYSSLSVIMSIIWILLMILPIVHFIYLKKNRIAPYNS